MGGLFALVAALGFTIDSILTRKGLMEENPGTIWDIRLVISLAALSFFLLGVSIATLLGYDFLQEFKQITYLAVSLLIFAGVLGPFMGAFLLSTAISQIGPAHASALWAGSNPLFVALLAVIFLKEIPDLMGIFSVFIIVGGIIVVGYHGHEGTARLLEKTKLAGGFIALIAGILVALSQIGRGAALNFGATPISALFLFQGTAFIIVTTICFIKSKNFKYLKDINQKSLYCYSGAGISFLIANYFLLASFTLIPVWQAVAIRNIQPILAIFLSWIFLKKVDKINLRLVLGAALVTVGVVLLNVCQ